MHAKPSVGPHVAFNTINGFTSVLRTLVPPYTKTKQHYYEEHDEYSARSLQATLHYCPPNTKLAARFHYGVGGFPDQAAPRLILLSFGG